MSSWKARADLPLLASGALGTWLGIHAFRSFLAMVVWNTAEDMPALQMGLIALGIYLVGLLAWLPARLMGGARPAWRFGLLFAALTVARQALPGEVLSPLFAFAAGIAWMWWLPAYLTELTQRGALRLATPGVLIGLALQSAGQAAAHGLDLPMLRGGWSILGAAVQAGLFAWVLWQTGRHDRSPDQAVAGAEGGAIRGALVLGPFLFLQLTLLANMGRMAFQRDWGVASTEALIQLSLLAGVFVLRWSPSRWIRAALGVLALALSWPVLWEQPFTGPWFAIPLQALLALTLAGAFSPVDRPAPADGELDLNPAPGRIYAATAGGLLLLFALVFAYYSVYTWPALWCVGVALVFVPSLWANRPAAYRAIRPLLAAAAVAVAGVGLSLVPAAGHSPAVDPAPAALNIFHYNIHQGFDTWSVPSMPAIANTIRAADADLVGLQEVGRGWNLSGGVDLLAYLRWRFPDYYITYAPTTDPLWGNVIMSRYPMRQHGSKLYAPGKSSQARGLLWAEIPTRAGDLFFVTTHFTAYAGYDDDRTAQAEALLATWHQMPHTIITGDLNAHPQDEAIQKLTAGGLTDVHAEHGLGDAFTYSVDRPVERLDYIFRSADIGTPEAWIPRVTASDHLPMAATIILR